MIGPEIQVPDVTEAVIGYRQFGLAKRGQHNYHLVSPHTNDPWPTVERTAKCNNTIASTKVVLDGIRPRQHAAPNKNCGCGIYAYFDPCPVHKRDSMHWSMSSIGAGPEAERVAALVTMTGRIEVHARGMRSQHARICALGVNGNLNADERIALKVIADEFGVPLVPQEDLPKLATEFGRPLDESMRPQVDQPKPPAVPDLAAIRSSYESAVETRRVAVRPPATSVWINAAAAAAQVGCWVLWGSPLSLFAMAFSVAFAAFYFGKQRALR